MTGVVFNLRADALFKKARTTAKPVEVSTALITTGVFRVSRHPMYLGMVLILLGIGVLLGSLTPLIVVILFFALMESVFIKTEEKMLAARFGSEWADFKNAVRKWV